MSLSKTHKLPTVLVKPRKRWLRPDMTEKLLTGTLSLNTKPCTEILNKTVAINSSDISNSIDTMSPSLLTIISRVGVIKIVIVINCNLITFFKIIENNCNSAFTLITVIEM